MDSDECTEWLSRNNTYQRQPIQMQYEGQDVLQPGMKAIKSWLKHNGAMLIFMYYWLVFYYSVDVFGMNICNSDDSTQSRPWQEPPYFSLHVESPTWSPDRTTFKDLSNTGNIAELICRCTNWQNKQLITLVLHENPWHALCNRHLQIQRNLRTNVVGSNMCSWINKINMNWTRSVVKPVVKIKLICQ